VVVAVEINLVALLELVAQVAVATVEIPTLQVEPQEPPTRVAVEEVAEVEHQLLATAAQELSSFGTASRRYI
jgi:hypothetical protein